MGELLDGLAGVTWRNFSVPWHDPAMTPNSETGKKHIMNSLENQIIPTHGIIFLAGVYSVKSCQKWLDIELEMARKHKKPVIGVPPYGESAIPADLSGFCDQSANWNASEIIRALDSLMVKV